MVVLFTAFLRLFVPVEQQQQLTPFPFNLFTLNFSLHGDTETQKKPHCLLLSGALQSMGKCV